ncbi:MAG: right-handed parallel beta-helix repeat-containing protein [Armatimonadota bacterium]|nr:right-handed parallel beta-helix repeat-containing protein [Armatimonadota bacterium]
MTWYFYSLAVLLASTLPCAAAKHVPNKRAPVKRAMPPVAVLDITAAPYNAKGDGASDNTSAINQALADAAAAIPKKSVYAPLGTFAHSGVLRDGGVIFFGSGAGTVFQATNPAEGAVALSGARGAVQRCTLVSPVAKDRLSTSDSAAISVNGATDFTISNVNIGAEGIQGAASAGILCADRPSSHGTLTHNRVSNTLADGIHLTAGARDMVVSGNTLVNVGDDMIAVVSYLKDGAEVTHVKITENHCVSQTNGRGISVVGGDDVTIDGNTIESSDVAGIYLASEDSYNTYGPSNVQVIGNTIRNANQKHAVTHGGIYVFGRVATVDGVHTAYLAKNVTISGNTLLNTYYMGIRIGGHAKTIRITGNRIVGTTAEGIAVSDTGDRSEGAGARDIVVSGNTIKSTAWGAIKVSPGAQGALTITDNRLADIGTSDNSGVDAISIDPGASAVRPLRLTGNRYDGFAFHSVRDFINCGVSAAAAGTSAAAIRSSNAAAPGMPIVVTP